VFKVKAIVLLSGGLDSTVILALALKHTRKCKAISFEYGQRHNIELESAKAIARYYNVAHHIIKLDPSIFGQSSLLSKNDGFIVPKDRDATEISKSATPSTYVPARNTIFLSVALAQAEMFGAQEIYIGPNALDTKYPDCSPQFIESFQSVINVATKQSVQGGAPKLIAPLLMLNKSDIIKLGLQIEAPMHLSFSCYDPVENKPCLRCDACRLREDGFRGI
jgi:7-cyano-7-deazaguanine synthase